MCYTTYHLQLVSYNSLYFCYLPRKWCCTKHHESKNNILLLWLHSLICYKTRFIFFFLKLRLFCKLCLFCKLFVMNLNASYSTNDS